MARRARRGTAIPFPAPLRAPGLALLLALSAAAGSVPAGAAPAVTTPRTAPTSATPHPPADDPARMTGATTPASSAAGPGNLGTRGGLERRRARSYANCNRAAHRRKLYGGERRRFVRRCQLGYEPPASRP